MKFLTRMAIGFFLAANLTACITQNNFAPIDIADPMDDEQALQPGQHLQYRVRRGDTLYSIAFRYDLDFRQLARINHLNAPYALTTGQMLHIEDQPQQVIESPKLLSLPKKIIYPGIKPIMPLSNTAERQGNNSNIKWMWPVKGEIIRRFAPWQHSKGVEIAAPEGTKVRATAAGTVAYAGSGLRAYGNLLIIKHNDRYLSAYAYNRELLVKEGDVINAGQVIAIVGHKHQQSSRLHFEIRVAGKPVDPLQYLNLTG